MSAPESIPLVERGLEVFLHGFSTTRSLTHPYLVRHLHPSIWVLADAPRTRGNPRQSEVVVYGGTPDETVETVQREGVGRHLLCVLLESAEEADATRDAYKQRGYRLADREALFVLPLEQRVDYAGHPVRRVTERADAEAIAKAARGRQLQPEHLEMVDPPIRLYGTFDGDTPVGWVSSVVTEAGNWVANLFVHPHYRRRGIGKSLMSRMLEEDARYGATHSALLASRAGALLYPHLGYEQHGLLMLFFSPRGSSAGSTR